MIIREVTDRFKGLDLKDRVPEELWTEVHDIVREAGISRQDGAHFLETKITGISRLLLYL